MQCTATLWKGQTGSSQSGAEPLTSFHMVMGPSLTFTGDQGMSCNQSDPVEISEKLSKTYL